MAKIYFIQAQTEDFQGPIKIGYARNARARIANLQTGCPHEIRLISMMVEFGESAPSVEARLHEAFRVLHIRGEWFEWHPAIINTARSFLPFVTAPPDRATAEALRFEKLTSDDRRALSVAKRKVQKRRDEALFERMHERAYSEQAAEEHW